MHNPSLRGRAACPASVPLILEFWWIRISALPVNSSKPYFPGLCCPVFCWTLCHTVKRIETNKICLLRANNLAVAQWSRAGFILSRLRVRPPAARPISFLRCMRGMRNVVLFPIASHASKEPDGNRWEPLGLLIEWVKQSFLCRFQHAGFKMHLKVSGVRSRRGRDIYAPESLETAEGSSDRSCIRIPIMFEIKITPTEAK